MEELWEFYYHKDWVKPFLLYSIYFFVFVSITLFSTIVVMRRLKLRNQKLEKRFTPIIEHILSLNLFESAFFSEFSAYEKLFRNGIFRNLMMESIINLHQNYDGTYAENLENFYIDSGLINDSYKKLNSEHWQIKCKGINELAEMNVAEAFGALVKMSKSSNKILTIVAINACIKLNGSNGIRHLARHKHSFDLWTQLNILDALKQGNLAHIQGLEYLLTSKNNSVVSLGLKAISSLNLSEKAPFVQELIDDTTNEEILTEAKTVLNRLIVQNNRSLKYEFQ
jgi:hypothetical protein